MKHVKLFVIATCLGLLVTACAAAAPPPTPTAIPPSPTSPPPTATPIPPTSTPAPPTDTPEPTATPEPILITTLEEMLGDWRRTKPHPSNNREVIIRINADGTTLYSENEYLKVALSSLNRGGKYVDNFRFEGDHLFIETNGCVSIDPGKYEVYKLVNGNIIIKTTKDDCDWRRIIYAMEWEPVQEPE